MVLTDEQRKRMEENRKRALEIRKRKQIEKEKNEASIEGGTSSRDVFNEGGFVSEKMPDTENKKLKTSDGSTTCDGGSYRKEQDAKTKMNSKAKTLEQTKNADIADDVSLEDFECNASAYITQTEAQRAYCVPLGTLAVCEFIEKDNPHNRGFSKMKLYLRSEVRRRSHKRFGGKEGLILEREKRLQKRFQKDLAEVKDAFR